MLKEMYDCQLEAQEERDNMSTTHSENYHMFQSAEMEIISYSRIRFK